MYNHSDTLCVNKINLERERERVFTTENKSFKRAFQ